jgi:hypothetical protein
MVSKELKRLSVSYGFDVAPRSSKSERVSQDVTTRTMAARALAIAKPSLTPNTKSRKKKKKKNPYAGPSGPFARKHNWSARKKSRKTLLKIFSTM